MRETNDDKNALPNRWVKTSLGKIVLNQRPKIKPGNFASLPFIGMDDIEPGSMQLSGHGSFADMKSAGVHVYERDVIFGRLRPYLNKTYTAQFEAACSAEFIVFPANYHVDSNFLKYRLHSRDFINYASDPDRTTGDRPRVDAEAIAPFEILLPPHAEQKRIVSKIDELFSKIDEGEANLKRVEVLVKQYRQSVLKAAVTGELTIDWRAQNADKTESGEDLLKRILKARRVVWEDAELAKMREKGKEPKNDKWKEKYNEPAAPDTTDLPDLPDGWVWATLGQICAVTGGVTKNAKRAELSKQLPYLRVANVYANELRLDEIKQIGIKESEIDRTLLQANDLLIVEGNGSLDQIGRVAAWDGSISPCLHQNHLIKARLFEPRLSKFALLWLLSPEGRSSIVRVASSSAGLYTLSISKVGALPIPIPSATEAEKIGEMELEDTDIVRYWSSVLTSIQNLPTGLRQSILKEAFSGRLVPQDTEDEPATVLLERIGAEREAQKAAEKAKKAKQKKPRKKARAKAVSPT